MDAVKFVKKRKRMFNAKDPEYGLFDMNTRAEDVVKEVEEWSAAHPRKTRQSVFLAQWPEAKIDKFGILAACQKRISADCRKKYDDCGTSLQARIDKAIVDTVLWLVEAAKMDLEEEE